MRISPWDIKFYIPAGYNRRYWDLVDQFYMIDKYKRRKMTEPQPSPFDDLRNDAPWMEEALCAQVGPGGADAWFPNENVGMKSKEAQMAVRICQDCPVRRKCLKYAIKNEVDDGIWGGVYFGGDKRSKATKMEQARKALAA